MVEEVKSLSIEKLKQDIQAKFEHDFSQFAPLSIRYDAITAQDNRTFTVSFQVFTHESIRAGFIGDVWYDDNGQLNTYDLIRFLGLFIGSNKTGVSIYEKQDKMGCIHLSCFRG